MRVFLDANVLFSAAKSEGAMRALIDLVLDAGHQCWADAYVVEEARRNLAAKQPDQVRAFEVLLRKVHVGGLPAHDATLAATLPLPEKDRPILMAAIHHRCALVVTGDRTHFGALHGKTLHGVRILSPRMLAEKLLAKGR
jgi:predicted nucleic acid-binding protein